MTGTFDPTTSSNTIWFDDDMEDCLTSHIEDIEDDIAALETGKANFVHTHPTYADIDHTHSNYALTTHTHSGYATTDHTHTGYATSTHSHSEYALATDVDALEIKVGDSTVASQISTAIATKADSNHTHTEYAPADHTHSGYASISHSHSEYSNVNHTHTGYASSTHVHSYNDLEDKPTIPTTLPANGGNADTVDGKHANEFATATDLAALQTLVGDTAVSVQINTAMAGKVDVVEGKGLSTNDFTTAEKTKLAGIAAGANKITVDSALNSFSTNPVQNKVIKNALAGKADANHVHNVFGSLTEIGITTFPTTMSAVASAMSENSMIIIDTRRINGTGTSYGTETISDWGNTTNGMALIMKGATTARVTMMILYGSSESDHGDFIMGNYAITPNSVNWTTLGSKLDDKVDKISRLSAVNLNTITETGLYYVSSGTTALHYPAGSNGHLLVMSDGTRVRQVYFRVGTVNTNSFQWYSRSLGSDTTVGENGWSQWWLLSGFEKIWNGGTVLNSEINIGSRYGCTSWVVVARLQNTGALASVVIPRAFLVSDTTTYRFQIADETAYISFYIYYKSDNDVYLKVVDQTDSTYTTLKYVYRMS